MTTSGRKIVVGQGVGESDLRSGIWTRGEVRAGRLVCQAAKRQMGYSGAEMARFLGVTISSVNRVTVSDILPKVRKYLNALRNLVLYTFPITMMASWEPADPVLSPTRAQ